MELKFLFWNIGGLSAWNSAGRSVPFEEEIKNIVDANNIDVLILSEGSSIKNKNLSTKLGFVSVPLKQKNGNKKWIQVFYRAGNGYKISHKSEYSEVIDKDENVIEAIYSGKPIDLTSYFEVNRIQLFEITGSINDTLFACIHFPSKLYHDEATHMGIVPVYKSKIHSLAGKNNRLFIVGDFNMNPFDLGMVEPVAFYSHHNKQLVDTDKRWHMAAYQPLYYNPCWTLLGDFQSGNPTTPNSRMGGTLHYEERKSRKLHWYVIDQVIMRKALIDEFNPSYLQVVEKQEYIDEILKPKQKKQPKLDHLPIKFSFTFK